MHGKKARYVENVAAAVPAHDGYCFAAAIKRAGKIGLNRRVPFFRRELIHRLENADAGIVHENVEPTKSVDSPLDHAPAIRVAPHVSDNTVYGVRGRQS